MSEPGSQRVPGLDTLRALAITLVVIRHYPNANGSSWTRWIWQYGWAGVDLFFVLSGYLITSQLLSQYRRDQSISFADFYRRRCLRILPSFLVVLTLYFCIPALREFGTLAPLWRYLSFTLNFGLDFKKYGSFVQVWSLCVEEHFYMILPVFLSIYMPKATFKRSLGLAALLVIMGAMIRAIEWNHHVSEPFITSSSAWVPYLKKIGFPTYCRLDGLIVGACLAALQSYRAEIWNRMLRSASYVGGFGFLCLAGGIWLCRGTTQWSFLTAVLSFPVFAFGFGAWLILSLNADSRLSHIHVPGASLIAKWSYCIYLTHGFSLHLFHNACIQLGVSAQGFLTVGFSILVILLPAAFLSWAVETPVLKLRDRLIVPTRRESPLPVPRETSASEDFG